MNRQLLEDKVIVLLGASSGLGLHFAETFAEEGGIVVMCGRTESTLMAAADSIAQKGGRVFPMVADLKSCDDARRVFAAASKEYGHVDALVTNATYSAKLLSIEACDDQYINDIVDTNVKGLMWWNREAMKYFLEQNSGSIVNIGSNNVGRPVCDPIYCATKYAELGMTKQMALRCVGTGVRCNQLNPGSMKSVGSSSGVGMSEAEHMYDDQELVKTSGVIPVENGSLLQLMKAKTNRAVPVDMKQVAFAAVYLISDLSKDVTGQVLTVDRGGYL